MSWNAEVKSKPGDLIEIHRTHYQHWAIYIGNGDVIHLAPKSDVLDLHDMESFTFPCLHIKPRLKGQDIFLLACWQLQAEGFRAVWLVTGEGPGAGFSSLSSLVDDRAVVKKEPLWKVVGDDKYQINNKYDERYRPLPVREIISRAKAEVGRVMPYSVVSQNCEHFVTDLRYDTSVSDQVTQAFVIGGAALVGTAAIIGLATWINNAVERRRQDE